MAAKNRCRQQTEQGEENLSGRGRENIPLYPTRLFSKFAALQIGVPLTV